MMETIRIEFSNSNTSLHDAVLSESKFYDDDISPNDVVKTGEHNYIYLISIAIYKKYQGFGIGKYKFSMI